MAPVRRECRGGGGCEGRFSSIERSTLDPRGVCRGWQVAPLRWRREHAGDWESHYREGSRVAELVIGKSGVGRPLSGR